MYKFDLQASGSVHCLFVVEELRNIKYCIIPDSQIHVLLFVIQSEFDELLAGADVIVFLWNGILLLANMVVC